MGLVLFRVEGNTQIGAGHLVRCLALADNLRAMSQDVIFVGRLREGSLDRLVERAGFRWISLPEVTAQRQVVPAGAVDSDDAADTIAVIRSLERSVDWLVVDHYGIDIRWETDLRPVVGKILVIDDLANRQHDCDILLDQNFADGADGRYSGLVPQSARQMLGPRYALLRPQFLESRIARAEASARIGRVVVAFGGADPLNATGRVLESMLDIDIGYVVVDVVIGAASPHREALAQLVPRARSVAIHFHSDVANMAGMWAGADLAIGAGGISNWERLCVGVPSLVLSVAENQVPSATALGRAGYCLYLGRLDDVSNSSIGAAIVTLISSATLRSHFSRASARLVDGKGAERVATELTAPVISFRLATESDATMIYGWRNAEEVRKFSRDTRSISWEDHSAWLKKSVVLDDRIVLIAECDSNPSGVLRFDLFENSAEVSIYLSPAVVGRGIGSSVLSEGVRWFRARFPEVKRLRAEIRPENERSARAFAIAGFRHSLDYYEADL